MILYIHGFGGSGRGHKAKAFQKHYKQMGKSFLAPSLSYIPDLAIDTLEQICQNCKEVSLIGSSLGGYYALYLAKKYNLKAVVINPALYPYKQLVIALGDAPSFFDVSSFSWTQSHLDTLKKYDVKTLNNNVLFLLQKGDELLDYQDAFTKYENPKVLLEEGGSHSFEQIETKFEIIDSFLLH